jgi:hypothetical protein
MLNMGRRQEKFALPELKGLGWRLAVDTGRAPYVFDPEESSGAQRGRYGVAGRSLAVLEGVAL